MTEPKKIAVLGGGMAAMTAVYEITSIPNWQEQYDITVYQLGWRLGGKGASGRRRDVANRIEEHGVHLWFGAYDNSFGLIQRVYRDNARPFTHPMPVWESAFEPCDFLTLEERVGDEWVHWPMRFLRNQQMPGYQSQQTGIWDSLGNLIKTGLTLFQHHIPDHMKVPVHPRSHEHKKAFGELYNLWDEVLHEVEAAGLDIIGAFIYAALRFVERHSGKHDPSHHGIIGKLAELLLKWLWEKFEHIIEHNTDARRLWIACDLGVSTIRGIIADKVISEGYDVINGQDYRAWLKKHGATEITLDSALVQALYGLVLSGYKMYSYEAGTLLRILMRFFGNYRGAFYYRMKAGMGDCIFAPIYEVLKKRGVTFKFFHKVKNLGLSPDKKQIEAITIGRQVNLKNGNYEPLFNVKGLPCWPSTPLFEQIVEGEQLKREKINLESAWTSWQDVEEIELTLGKDFDEVLLGIALGALPYISKELVDSSKSWANMLGKIVTTPSQSSQIWLYPDDSGMGWPYWRGGLAFNPGTYVEPLDAWSDMSQLINRESWSDENSPNAIIYILGSMMKVILAPFSDHDFPTRQNEELRKRLEKYLNKDAGYLWPLTQKEGNNGFNWDLIVGDSQDKINNEKGIYVTVNIDPTAWYVLAEAGTSKYRLSADGTDFKNLIITGDWTRNGMDAGCIESAVMSGMQASRAICGSPKIIYGENDD